MFKKKTRRNFRQRKGESSSDEDEQKKSGDAAGEVHKVSARPPGRGIACSSKREEAPVKSDSSDPDDGAAAAEEKGKREHDQLMTEKPEQSDKKEGHKRKGNAVLSFSGDKEVSGAPEFQLRKSSDKAVVFKKIKRKHDSRSTAIGSISVSSRLDSQCPIPEEEEEEEDDDDDDDGPATPYSSASSLSDTSVPEQVPTVPTVIPDIKDIEAAKRRRRKARAQKEFIPLGMKDQNSPASSSDIHSREDEDEEVGDNDSDNEKDDHERRIEFAPRTKSIRERITEKLGGSGDSGGDSSEREDQDVWEEMQIGKGVKRRPGEQSPSGSDSSWTGRQRRKTRSHLPETLPPVSISTVMRRINAKLESLKEVYRARQAELRRMEGDAESSRTSIEKLEEGSSEGQLKFFKKMNVYSQNLVECLQEKVMEINSLEVELHSLLSDHMEALVENRRQTVRDEAGRLQQLTYGAAEQSGGGPSQREDVTDDACVDTPEDTQPSSEEEDELQRKRVAILQCAQSVFSDVEEGFSDVQKVLRAFEEWRDFHPDSYQNAYISLCLPKLLNPHIRHQILSWNPLTDGIGDVEALPWYGAVESFCLNQEHTDTQTFTNVVEKTLLPKITAYVELVWDPLSHRQSVCLSDVCRSLRDDFSVFQGEQSKPVKVFVQAVVSRLRSCVDEDIFIPLFPKHVLEDLTSPQCRFRDRQLWTAVKLLGNMRLWDQILPESVLKDLMLNKLLNARVMIILLNQSQTNPLHILGKIADSLPESWFVELSECLPELQSLSDLMLQTVDSICKNLSPEDPTIRSTVLKILQLLNRIRSFESIQTIAEKYNCQEMVYSQRLLNN